MGEIRDNVRRNLQKLLKERKMTQKELALKLGVSQSAVTNWIKGKNAPDIETVARLCEILNISVVDLFGVQDRHCYTQTEQQLIECYRRREDMQRAVQILLGMQS